MASENPTATPAPFPKVFWSANLTELFERAAYYSMASFVVIYLGQLGLGKYLPSTLNSLLWGLVYFLPILSGTIADLVGFRRALLVAFVLLAFGYLAMGAPVWLLGAPLSLSIGDTNTADVSLVWPAILGVLLIGLGGSVIKPCISGTVQKTHMGRATLAFAIFYMVINIGSVVGRVVAFFVRRGSNVSYIFAVAMAASVIAFFVVLALYREPQAQAAVEAKPRRSIKEILLGMVKVLGNGRFVLFLVVSSGFNFLYTQVYNVLPLYTKRVLETEPNMDLYTAANPVTIVLFQLLITKMFGKMKAIHSIIAFFVVLALYREPQAQAAVEAKPRRSIKEILLGMVKVLGNGRFVLFLVVSSGFNFLYTQVYNVLPLYTKRVLETEPNMDLYTAANPVTIVLFQLLITKMFGKMKAIHSIIVGTVIIAASMALNLYPLLTAGGPRLTVLELLPIGSLFIVLTVVLVAFGELFTSARTFEWIGALAPKGQEGLFLGYANLPMAIGVIIGGPAGAWIFNEVMCKGARPLDNGLLELDPSAAMRGWIILMVIGLASALSMWLYNAWLQRQTRLENAGAPAPAP